MKMTYRMAHAIATDEGTTRMRSDGRSSWSREDYNAAVRRFNELYPLEEELYDAGEAAYWQAVYNGLARRMGR